MFDIYQATKRQDQKPLKYSIQYANKLSYTEQESNYISNHVFSHIQSRAESL